MAEHFQQRVKMKGSYNGHSSTQKMALSPILDILKGEARRKVSEHPGRKWLRVADYGCALGGNTIAAIEAIVSGVRMESESVGVVIYMVDFEWNDWETVAKTLRETLSFPIQWEESGWDDSTLNLERCEGEGNIVVAATKGSFHTNIVGADVVDIGFSGTAMHWLSSAKMRNCICEWFLIGGDRSFRNGSVCEACYGEWKELASNDWSRIVGSRLDELTDGGLFIAVIPCYADSKGTGGSSVVASEWVAKKILPIDKSKALKLRMHKFHRSERELLLAVDWFGSRLHSFNIEVSAEDPGWIEQYTSKATGTVDASLLGERAFKGFWAWAGGLWENVLTQLDVDSLKEFFVENARARPLLWKYPLTSALVQFRKKS